MIELCMSPQEFIYFLEVTGLEHEIKGVFVAVKSTAGDVLYIAKKGMFCLVTGKSGGA